MISQEGVEILEIPFRIEDDVFPQNLVAVTQSKMKTCLNRSAELSRVGGRLR